MAEDIDVAGLAESVLDRRPMRDGEGEIRREIAEENASNKSASRVSLIEA
jgi:hypothetical protein